MSDGKLGGWTGGGREVGRGKGMLKCMGNVIVVLDWALTLNPGQDSSSKPT